MEKIKLVIWDLDETFWHGTLSEGGVTMIPQNIEIVKELTRRGIINSISSKNDYFEAKKELQKAGIWDFFVFPSIAWTPKGNNVKTIIDNCQLRSPNILFIDDNHGNRMEVEHYNTGINTSNEEIIPQLLDLPELKGKDDSSYSRLKQYKLLEKKHEVSETYSDNHSFLIDSQIQLTFLSDVDAHFERILELVNRTNQLNFTKIRLNGEELKQVLHDNNYQNGCIHVKDRFGDYGICGFFSLNKCNNELTHFLFSCRILNMGVEAYVYQRLNRPKINVIEPVSGFLFSNDVIDWIQEDSEKSIWDIESRPSSQINSQGRKTKILFLGGCDLEQVCHYVYNSLFDITQEFNYPNQNGIPVHKEHTVFLRAMQYCSTLEKREIVELPFGDSKMFDSKLFTDDYDVLVYSVLMNYTQDVYCRKGGSYKVAFGGYTTNMEDALARIKACDEEKEFFANNYEYLGQQTIDEFKKDIEWLITRINKPIIFINGAEVEDFNEKESGACKRHHEMNIALDEVVLRHSDQCKLIDMRKIVLDRSQNTDNLRHYIRPVYVKMAEELMTLLNGDRVSVGQSKVLRQRIVLLMKKIITKIR